MRWKGVFIPLLAFFIVVPSALSQDNYRVVDGPEKSYYGHISLVEILNDGKDPVVIRPGAEGPLQAVLNFPLGPGDTIRTSDARRVEIQFDNATIVRLDRSTELKIETILARSLSRRETSMTNLVLSKGRIYVMYKEYDSGELFQVLTPNAAVKLRHNTVATVSALPDSSSDIQVAYGKATAMFGRDEKNLSEAAAGRSERLVIDAAGTAMSGVPSPDPDFASWNDSINRRFEELHEGKSALPKPLIRGATKATWYFAQTFGDKFGEWLYDDLYGYVWRPFYNDHYPGGTWRPYYYGQWVGMGSQMFWIPSEPWGWVPYHLGVWQWDAKRGWFWLPGSAFAPAWVDWAYMNGSYYAWRPWSMFDWMYASDMFWSGGSWFQDYAWLYYGSYGPGANFRGGEVPGDAASTRRVVSKDQLKQPSGSPALAMPKEFNRVLKAIQAGLKRGDARLVDTLRAGVQPALLGGNRIVNPPRAPGRSGLGVTPVGHAAPRLFPALNRMIAPAASLATRGIDWNPDIRLGSRLGINIRYESRTNEVVCPELKLSSAMMGRSVLVERGSARSSGGPTAPGMSGGSMSAGGSSSEGSSSGAASSGTSSAGGGGHIR